VSTDCRDGHSRSEGGSSSSHVSVPLLSPPAATHRS